MEAILASSSSRVRRLDAALLDAELCAMFVRSLSDAMKYLEVEVDAWLPEMRLFVTGVVFAMTTCRGAPLPSHCLSPTM